MYLEGDIEREDYKDRQGELMSEKKSLEGKIERVLTNAGYWIEPKNEKQKSRRGARRQISFPPEKQLAGATRRQRKNRPRGRQFPFFSQNGAILHFRANPVPAGL